MAENEIGEYLEIDANNVDIAGISVQENVMRPPAVNNAFRALQGALKRWFRTDLFRLRDSTDQTKLAAFDLSGIPTGTTRTYTFPAAGGVINNSAVSAMDARRNLFVNSNFAQSQERGDVLGTSNGYYPADQIALYFNASGAAVSVQRVQIRTLSNSLNQIEFKTTTAKAVLGANDFVTLTQPIEGSSIAEAGWGTAAAKPLVLRFQVTQPAGTYHVHVNNAAANRNISVPFIVAGGEANTAVVKTVTIPGDTTGTWLTADGVIGATFDIVLSAGTSLTGGTAGVWGASYLIAASTQFNILSSTANVARIADIGAKVDPDATGDYGAWKAEVDALYRPDRYYYRGAVYGVGSRSTLEANGILVTPFNVPRLCKNGGFGATLNIGSADGEGVQVVYPGQLGWSFARSSSTGAILIASLPSGQSSTVNVPWRTQFEVLANARLS